MNAQEQIAAIEAQLALLKAQPAAPAPAPAKPLIKIDLGCGSRKREGFLGVDQYAMPGVDVVADVRGKWPWEDNSVEEAHSSHFVEHLSGTERMAFYNELWRVLVPGGKATIIVPACFSARAYGDPTHQWPPIGAFTWPYLSRAWREANAPHCDAKWLKGGYACDFDATYGASLRGDLQSRNPEYVAAAIGSQIEAAQDLIATLVAKK